MNGLKLKVKVIALNESKNRISPHHMQLQQNTIRLPFENMMLVNIFRHAFFVCGLQQLLAGQQEPMPSQQNPKKTQLADEDFSVMISRNMFANIINIINDMNNFETYYQQQYWHWLGEIATIDEKHNCNNQQAPPASQMVTKQQQQQHKNYNCNTKLFWLRNREKKKYLKIQLF